MNTLLNGTKVKIISLDVLLQEREKFFRFRSREDDPLKTLTPEQLAEELYIDRHEGFSDDHDHAISLYRVAGIKFSFWPFTITHFLIPETALRVINKKTKIKTNTLDAVTPQPEESFEFKLFIDTEFVALKEGYSIREVDDSPLYTRHQIKCLYILLYNNK